MSKTNDSKHSVSTAISTMMPKKSISDNFGKVAMPSVATEKKKRIGIIGNMPSLVESSRVLAKALAGNPAHLTCAVRDISLAIKKFDDSALFLSHRYGVKFQYAKDLITEMEYEPARRLLEIASSDTRIAEEMYQTVDRVKKILYTVSEHFGVTLGGAFTMLDNAGVHICAGNLPEPVSSLSYLRQPSVIHDAMFAMDSKDFLGDSPPRPVNSSWNKKRPKNKRKEQKLQRRKQRR